MFVIDQKSLVMFCNPILVRDKGQGCYKNDGGDKDEQEGGREGKEDGDNGSDPISQLVEIVMHRNTLHYRQPLPCGTNSP